VFEFIRGTVDFSSLVGVSAFVPKCGFEPPFAPRRADPVLCAVCPYVLLCILCLTLRPCLDAGSARALHSLGPSRVPGCSSGGTARSPSPVSPLSGDGSRALLDGSALIEGGPIDVGCTVGWLSALRVHRSWRPDLGLGCSSLRLGAGRSVPSTL